MKIEQETGKLGFKILFVSLFTLLIITMYGFEKLNTPIHDWESLDNFYPDSEKTDRDFARFSLVTSIIILVFFFLFCIQQV